MRVLVTGATGFLGRHLVPLLAERGDEVRALVRPQTDDSRLRALGVEVVPGRLDDAEALRRAAAGRERVFHLAGVVGHERRDLPRLTAANVDGVRHVLAAVEPDARLVHVSSVVAMGPTENPSRPATEQQPFPEWAWRFPYPATKRAGEEIVVGAVATGRDCVIANPGFVIGPGDVYRVSTWPIQRYLQGTLRIHARGGISLVDARDVAAGLIALAERGRRGERYILTCREGNLPWRDIFRRTGEVTGVRRTMIPLPVPVAHALTRVVPWPIRPGEARLATNWWFFDPTKAERELGFATRPLDETIAATAAEYR